jgi:hypothetical protein
MTQAMPASLALRAACSLLDMPPLPSGPELPASASTSRLTASTTGTNRALGSLRGSALCSPDTSLRMTNRSAPIRVATSDDRLSLSPKLKRISSIATLSFSLTIGSTPAPSSSSKVWRAFR